MSLQINHQLFPAMSLTTKVALSVALESESLKNVFFSYFDEAAPVLKIENDDLSHLSGEDIDESFRLISFNENHKSFQHPDELSLAEKSGIGLRRKLATGWAFPLSYFEHGNCVWSLQGTGPQCRWDSVRFAGILLLNKAHFKKNSTIVERTKWATSYLEEYTAWANGDGYCYEVGEDACGGFFSSDSAKDAAYESIVHTFRGAARACLEFADSGIEIDPKTFLSDLEDAGWLVIEE